MLIKKNVDLNLNAESLLIICFSAVGKYIFVISRVLIIACLLSQVELAGQTLSASTNVHGKY